MATVIGLTAERALEIEAAGIVSAAIDGTDHLIFTTGGGNQIDAGEVVRTVDDATTTVKGIVELATDAEVQTGTDTVRAVTPASLVASSTAKGIVELATNAEVATGTDTTRAVTPAGVASRGIPVETRRGSESVGIIAGSGGSLSLTLTFSPAFSDASDIHINLMLHSARCTWSLTSRAAASAVVILNNHSAAQATAGTVYWKAERY